MNDFVHGPTADAEVDYRRQRLVGAQRRLFAAGVAGPLEERVAERAAPGGTQYVIRRKDTGEYWESANPFRPGRRGGWCGHDSAATRYEAMSLAIMDSMQFDARSFEVEIVPVKRIR